ncbi:Uncharacterized protein APZ42_006598 [Daphnia magna]|uniref:Uncharacterized protein n=1 Tax=Daphnia magna TaxID=35525 RepID=A0A164FT00_9CRUS|nr:Uncharacterized protein APZ42_006598 [Daphnia magna]
MSPVIHVLSYAFPISRNTTVVDLFSLNPLLIADSRRIRLSVVVHPSLNPVWNFGRSRFFSAYHFNLLFIILSRTLQRHDVRDIGL